MNKNLKIATLAWMKVFLFPVAAVGYIIVAFGIGLKIIGYILKFNFDCVWSEIQGINENFKL